MSISLKQLKFIVVILAGLTAVVSFFLILTIIKQQPIIGHYATIMSHEFYDEAYNNAPPTIISDTNTAGGIVNHHLLAAPLLAQFFDGFKNQKPKHIIIIGPDHMSRGEKPITVSAHGWKTGYGDIQPDTVLIQKLFKSGVVNIEEDPFDEEFSVGGLVTFSKRSFKNALVTTIIIRDNTKHDDLIKLASALPRSNDTIVIVSIDFSHYLPSDAADFHDLTARTIISNFDIANLNKVEIDSVPTLRTALEYFKLRGTQKTTLVASTNSAKITGKPDTQETTSYLNQYFSIGEKTPFIVTTSLYMETDKKIISPEDRFIRGFMGVDDGSTLPTQFKKPNLAVGIARYADKTVYYLFPTIIDKKVKRLMTAAERAEYFRQNDINESIVTIQN